MDFRGRTLLLDQSGDDVRLLHAALLDLGLPIPDAERQQALFGAGTRDAVTGFQQEHGLEPTGMVDEATARAVTAAVAAGTYTVTGTVASPDRAALGGLAVRIVDKNVGPDVTLVETLTDDQGAYQVSFRVPSLR